MQYAQVAECSYTHPGKELNVQHTAGSNPVCMSLSYRWLKKSQRLYKIECDYCRDITNQFWK